MTLKALILQRITKNKSICVWTPTDFFDLGSRDAIDKVLQRLMKANELRRLGRGLYDKPRLNTLSARLDPVDYRRVIEAVSRRDQVRILLDGMTCANDLGLTHAISGQVILHTDGRLCSIKLDNLLIQFKLTAPSKLYWAGHPAMRIVQALYWLHGEYNMAHRIDRDIIMAKLIQLLNQSAYGKIIQDDLRTGLHTLPSWMRSFIQELFESISGEQK